MEQNKKMHSYIIILERENKKYYINTYNDAIIEINDKENIHDFYNDFKRNGFYKPEKYFDKKIKKYWRKNYKELNITISLTENCIFDCVYCSQKDKIKNSKISIEIIDCLIEKIKKYIKKNKIKLKVINLFM